MYGVIYDVAAPVEMYDRISAAIDLRQAGDVPEGMLTHVAMPTEAGFRLVEVWATKEDSDRFGELVVGPAIEELGEEAAGTEPTVTEFEVRGLIVGAPTGGSGSADLPAARQTSEGPVEYIG